MTVPDRKTSGSKGRRSNGRVASRLVALSSAGIVAVYAAGFYRTKAAADRLADADAQRRRPDADAVPFTPAPPQPQRSPVTFALPTRPAPERINTAAPQSGSARQLPDAPAPVTAQTQPVNGVSASAAVEATPPAQEPPADVAGEPAVATQTGSAPATATLEQPVTAPAPPKPLPPYKDGTYLGWGSCRHGDIQASVTIAAGRITEAKIAQCWTRYSCSWIDPIVPQVTARQSPNVDYVSGATRASTPSTGRSSTHSRKPSKAVACRRRCCHPRG